MYEAVYNGKLSGNGKFTKCCQSWFEERYGFRKTLLTTSGTDALEMCAMLRKWSLRTRCNVTLTLMPRP